MSADRAASTVLAETLAAITAQEYEPVII